MQPGEPADRPECPLCREPGGEVLWQDLRCRVVRVDDAEQPGFCRVVWNRHAAEMTDLEPGEQSALLAVVLAVEAAVRDVVRPDKVNLASLGNVVPHVHWHVIPRWRTDSRFPQPIWAEPMRAGTVPPLPPDVWQRLASGLAERLRR